VGETTDSDALMRPWLKLLFEQYLAAAIAVSHKTKKTEELMFLPALFVFSAMATALTFFSAFFKPLPQHLCVF